MTYEYLHELEQVEITTPNRRPLAELLPLFLQLGFTLHDDVVSLDRKGKIPPWQHSSIVEVETRCNGEEVFGFKEGVWDSILLRYLFATLPYELTDTFVDVTYAVSRKLSLPVKLRGVEIDEVMLRECFSKIREDLTSETGMDAGSEELAIWIHSTYPRR